MTPTEAKRIVLTSVLIGGAIGAVGNIRSGRFPGPSVLLAVGVTLVMLTALADAAPRVAAGLATTAAVGTAISAGPDAFQGIDQAVTPQEGIT